MGLAGFFGFICVCGERADGKWLGRCERRMVCYRQHDTTRDNTTRQEEKEKEG